MKKWDYKFIKITLPIASGINIQSDGTTQTEKTIKDFGAEGWELVSVTPMSELHYEIKNYGEDNWLINGVYQVKNSQSGA